MRILALPKNPDDDCQFYQVGGQRVGFLGTTPAHHSLGSPMYKVEVHPPGTTFPPNGLPVFTLDYRNDDGGPGYGKDCVSDLRPAGRRHVPGARERRPRRRRPDATPTA